VGGKKYLIRITPWKKQSIEGRGKGLLGGKRPTPRRGGLEESNRRGEVILKKKEKLLPKSPSLQFKKGKAFSRVRRKSFLQEHFRTGGGKTHLPFRESGEQLRADEMIESCRPPISKGRREGCLGDNRGGRNWGGGFVPSTGADWGGSSLGQQ